MTKRKLLLKSLSIIVQGGLIGCGIGLLWDFSLIWRHGSHFIVESNRAILTAETILLLLVVFGGMFFVWWEIKETRKVLLKTGGKIP